MGKVTDERCFTDCSWLHGMIRCRNCPYTKVERGNVIITDSRVKVLQSRIKKVISGK